MSIELVTTVLASASSTAVAKAISESVYTFIKEKLSDRGVRVEPTEDLDNIKALEKSIGSLLTKEEEEDITRSALTQAHQSGMLLRNERMRQAKTAFNAAVVLMIIGVIIIFSGIVLMFSTDSLASGAITTAVGAVTEVVSALLFRFNSEANNRLDEIGKHLNRIEAAQIAMNIAAKIEDPSKRDDAIRDAAVALSAAREQTG